MPPRNPNSALRIGAVLALFVLTACRTASAQLDIPGYVRCLPGTAGDLATTGPSSLTVTVDATDVRQTIHSFGASDAWSIQFIGQWPLAKREIIADLLFETGLDENNDPKGIGLSMWRFNIGAGSSRQNNIGDVWRRADTFYNDDFSDYDWTRLPGQRWFLRAAKARGVPQLTAFVNSPPINMTKNGNAFADPSVGTTNLADDKVDDFARYLADILAHFRSAEGIEFDVISPINEPQWKWEREDGQEGNRYSTGDIKRVVDALAQQDLGSTEIEVPESGQYVRESGDDLITYLDAFFDPASPDYIGDKVGTQIAGHSYWTDVPPDLISVRETVRSKLDEYPGLELVMSEYSPLGNNNYGRGRDLRMPPALYITRVLHFDMTIAEASSWQWWLGMSPYNYKDGLVYTGRRSFNDGEILESKMLWGMGNYSRFVRPGMQRVRTHRSDGSTPEQDQDGMMVSSYISARHNIAVTVIVNPLWESQTIQLDFRGMQIDSVIPYVTGLNTDLAAHSLLSPSDVIEIPLRSIVTLVGYHSELSLPPREVSAKVHTATVNPARPGVVPVSILGESDFDVRDIDRATLSFGPGGAQPTHRSGGHFDDVNDDELTDLVGHFRMQDADLAPDTDDVCVSGRLLDGGAFEGCDAIRTAPR